MLSCPIFVDYCTLCLVLSMYGGVVFAQVRQEEPYSLTRGVGTGFFEPLKKETASGVAWCSNLKSISCIGLPSGLIGSNYIWSRLRIDAIGYNYATPVITHSSSNYSKDGDNRVWKSYLDNFGGQNTNYRMAISMHSSSANTGCTVTYRWNP